MSLLSDFTIIALTAMATYGLYVLFFPRKDMTSDWSYRIISDNRQYAFYKYNVIVMFNGNEVYRVKFDFMLFSWFIAKHAVRTAKTMRKYDK